MTVLVPKKILDKWGAVAEEGFAFVTEVLHSRGFKGPLTWSHISLVPYSIQVCDTISVDLSISSASGHDGARIFDCSAVVLSKTLMVPMIQRLRSDQDLVKLMWEVIQYEKPQWVLSSKPSFAFFNSLFVALQRK